MRLEEGLGPLRAGRMELCLGGGSEPSVPRDVKGHDGDKVRQATPAPARGSGSVDAGVRDCRLRPPIEGQP